jgi:hypothetical protein
LAQPILFIFAKQFKRFSTFRPHDAGSNQS